MIAVKLIPCGPHGHDATKLQLLEQLQMLHSHQNHTIKLLDVIHSDRITDIIDMPWQLPLNKFLCHHSSLKLVKLLWYQIVEGVVTHYSMW